MTWTRVTKHNKCPICEHDSWCTYTEDIVLCMRIESKRPKQLSSGEIGWLHTKGKTCNHPVPIQSEQKMAPNVDWRKLMQRWESKEQHVRTHELSERLGISYGSLVALECSWAAPHQAWAFPMKDGYENVVGIRLRATNGDKFSVRGSHQGIFIPILKSSQTLLIVEGATDVGAAVDLGYYAVGRPSCSGGTPQIKQFIERYKIKRVIIIADNDVPGRNGAKMLVELLPRPCAIIVLPCKDLRQFKKLGGTKEMLDARIDQAVWQNVT